MMLRHTLRHPHKITTFFKKTLNIGLWLLYIVTHTTSPPTHITDTNTNKYMYHKHTHIHIMTHKNSVYSC